MVAPRRRCRRCEWLRGVRTVRALRDASRTTPGRICCQAGRGASLPADLVGTGRAERPDHWASPGRLCWLDEASPALPVDVGHQPGATSRGSRTRDDPSSGRRAVRRRRPNQLAPPVRAAVNSGGGGEHRHQVREVTAPEATLGLGPDEGESPRRGRDSPRRAGGREHPHAVVDYRCEPSPPLRSTRHAQSVLLQGQCQVFRPGNDVPRAGWRHDRLDPALRPARQQPRGAHQLGIIQRSRNRQLRVVSDGARPPEALQQRGDRVRRADLDHAVQVADVDAELECRGGTIRSRAPRRSPLRPRRSSSRQRRVRHERRRRRAPVARRRASSHAAAVGKDQPLLAWCSAAITFAAFGADPT